MKTYNIPSGTKNFKKLHPTLDIDNIKEYCVELLDSSNNVIGTSSTYVVDRWHQCNIRLLFFNSLGAFDSLNFNILESELSTTSKEIKSPIIYPLSKPQHELKRFNVEANETYHVISDDYYEPEMDWIRELTSSPMLWMEWSGTQGQSDSYLPVVLLDTPNKVKKSLENHTYRIELKFKLSHTYKSQR